MLTATLVGLGHYWTRVSKPQSVPQRSQSVLLVRWRHRSKRESAGGSVLELVWFLLLVPLLDYLYHWGVAARPAWCLRLEMTSALPTHYDQFGDFRSIRCIQQPQTGFLPGQGQRALLSGSRDAR